MSNRSRRRRSGGASRAARESRGQRPASTPTPQRAPRSAWRETLDSFGGPLVVGSITLAVVAVVALLIFNRPDNPAADASDAPLMGEEIDIGEDFSHVASETQLVIREGQPPVGGPHFAQAQPAGIYDEPVNDGNAIHALEHGLIWITYNPDLVSEEDVAALEGIAEDHRRDVVLSPRPRNEMPIAVASWGRLLTLEEADVATIEEMIETNLNRSPEPGVR